MTNVRTLLMRGVLAASTLLSLTGLASAQNAGFRTLTVTGEVPMTVALFYPTAVPARTIPMGPWQALLAPGAPAAQGQLKGLILLSHGLGGSEMNHHNLATHLAGDGYLVAALRHPGDNWEDRSMISSGRYFSERPRQVSRVLDALLASPEWGSRIPAERIGAVGHSAGAYTVLALAGGQAEPQRATQHCRTVQDDPGFCHLAKGATVADGSGKPAAPAVDAPSSGAGLVSVADACIRAVVALAPMAVVFTPESLAAIKVPVRLMMAQQDAVLNGKYHGAQVATNLPGAQTTTVASAGHFAFMAQSTMPMPSAAGDAAANPPGFDRKAYLPELERQVSSFFAAQLR